METVIKKENYDIINIEPVKNSNLITDVERQSLNSKGLSQQEIDIICDNTQIAIPTNSFDLYKFTIFQKENVEIAKKLLNTQNLSDNLRGKLLKKGQYFAEVWLNTELKLADEIRNIKTRQGTRSDLVAANDNGGKKKRINSLDSVVSELRTKAQILNDDYNITPNQARELIKLTKSGIEKAIEYCRENNEIPSRALAIKYSQKLKSALSKDEEEQLSVPNLKKTKFKFETQYSDVNHNPNFDRLLDSEDIPYCSLFSCIGSGEYYLENHGLKCLLANECDEERAKYFSAMYPDAEMIQGKIEDKYDELVKRFKELGCKLLIATPPCQTFCRQKSKNFLSDPRLKLFIHLVNFIKDTEPEWIVIENANEFLNFSHPDIVELEGKTIGDYIKDNLEECGYKVNFAIANAAYYGTAQNRVRSFTLASKNGVWLFPKADRFSKSLWEVIGNLPSLEAGEDSGIKYHKAPVLSNDINKSKLLRDVLSHTATGCSPKDNANPKYQMPGWGFFEAKGARKSWDKPSNTIESGSDSVEGLRTVHPGRLLADGTYSDARACTLLEILLLNGLPSDYEIPQGFDDEKHEAFMRDVMGEILLPRMLERIIETLPCK